MRKRVERAAEHVAAYAAVDAGAIARQRRRALLRKMHAVRPDRRPHRLIDTVAFPDGAIGESDFAPDRDPTLRFAPGIDLGEHLVCTRYVERRVAARDGRKRAGLVLT